MIAFIIVVVGFLLVLFIAVGKARRMNKEQSSLTMHPSNFDKPEIENVQQFPEEEKES